MEQQNRVEAVNLSNKKKERRGCRQSTSLQHQTEDVGLFGFFFMNCEQVKKAGLTKYVFIFTLRI